MLATQSPNPKPNPDLTFDLIFIGGQGIKMDYPRAKSDNFNFSHLFYRADRITKVHDCYSHATTVGVSKYSVQIHQC